MTEMRAGPLMHCNGVQFVCWTARLLVHVGIEVEVASVPDGRRNLSSGRGKSLEMQGQHFWRFYNLHLLGRVDEFVASGAGVNHYAEENWQRHLLFTLVLVLATQRILLHKPRQRILDRLCTPIHIQAQVEKGVVRVGIISAVVTGNSRTKTTSPDLVYPRGFSNSMWFFSVGGGNQGDVEEKARCNSRCFGKLQGLVVKQIDSISEKLVCIFLSVLPHCRTYLCTAN